MVICCRDVVAHEPIVAFGSVAAWRAPSLVSMEMGKIRAEGQGEVQEMIDVADFAVGLSRQLYGLTMHSERPGHRMYEQWHPLGVVGVISAFNFPVAVWAWNAMIAAVCGDCVLWKPSSDTPLTAIACQKLLAEVMAEMPEVPDAIVGLVIGDGLSTRSIVKARFGVAAFDDGTDQLKHQVIAKYGARITFRRITGTCVRLQELSGDE